MFDGAMLCVLPAVNNIVVDMLGVLVVAQIAVHHHLHQEEPDSGGEYLHTSGQDPVNKGDYSKHCFFLTIHHLITKHWGPEVCFKSI